MDPLSEHFYLLLLVEDQFLSVVFSVNITVEKKPCVSFSLDFYSAILGDFLSLFTNYALLNLLANSAGDSLFEFFVTSGH